MTTTTTFEETVSPDETALITEFVAFLKDASAARAREKGGPVQRFNQARAAGCVEAEFEVLDGLPRTHRVGLFAMPGRYRATIRFANATSASDRERDTRGMAVSVAGVPGANLTPGQTRQDFVLNSHPVMVAPDAREFLALLKANEAGGLRRVIYFAAHPKAARIAAASRQHHTCHLDIPYWSTTPYAFGPDRAVKYTARPSSSRGSRLPDRLTDTYLRDALRRHLEEAEASFDFMIQFHQNQKTTPIDDATVEWSPREAPWHPVARITIPRQAIDGAARVTSCEEMTFNPWHALEAHRPLGSMNRARREIYRALSEFRRSAPAG
jgi:hypothetical protein